MNKSLNIRRWGSGQRVVCLHAVGHSGEDFAAFAARVGPGYEVVAPDFPNDGGPVTPERYADLVEPLLGEAPILIGNSLGGAAAILLAARRPVKALVLCNSGGLAPVGPAERRAIAALVRFFDAGARRAWWFPAAFALYYRLVLPRADKRRREIVAGAYDIAPLLAKAWAGFARPEADLRGLTVTAPTLFAWTTGDRIIPWSKSKAAAERYPNRKVRFFRGGHAAFLEDADAFAAAFREGVP